MSLYTDTPESPLPDGFHETDVAVVGMACRFPGANDVDRFWANVRDGVESIRSLSARELREAGVARELLRDPRYVKRAAMIEDLERFDARFFGFSPRDAAIMDPQHRHFLECAYQALEHSGHTPERFDGAIGVFAGCGMNAYFSFNLLRNKKLMDGVGLFLVRHTANDKDFLATRVSYELDLRGPSVNVQTACSTSLVAIHMGCQSLVTGESDMILAGGVTLDLPTRHGYAFTEGEILSPDGRCRAFDHQAGGTVFGSGAGVVVLRRLGDALADGDNVLAVIRGSAVNNDGSGKVGYLAPSVDGQSAAIAEALAVAGVPPESIGFVQAHGTGTRVGDPIEVAALAQAYGAETDAKGFCALTSVKPNIGHLDTAAGVASFVTAVQALRHRQLPPNLHFERPNPMIDFDAGPFYVNRALADWTAGGEPRRAGVSSLGVGGTNAHVIIEEAPPQPAADRSARPFQLIQISARDRSALDRAGTRLATHLAQRDDQELADVAYTLRVGRRAFEERRVLAARDRDEAAALLASGDRQRVFTHTRSEEPGSLVFMLPGGGAQYPRMGRGLYETEPVYCEWIDRGLDVLRTREDLDLTDVLLAPPEDDERVAVELDRPAVQLPATFLVEYALAKLWISYGLEPAALIGHSMGENTAACLAGVLSFEDAVGLVALRGRLFERVPAGGMLSIPLPRAEVEALLGDELDLAVVNADELCVVSGPSAPLGRLADALAAREVDARRVGIAIAAHSRLLEPILADFGAYLRSIRLAPPRIPFISNRSGTWITDAEATDPDYWVRHLRNTIRFADGIATLAEDPDRILLEVGPGKILGSLARMHAALSTGRSVLSSLRHPDEETPDAAFFLTVLGRLWAAGADVDLDVLHAGETRRRVDLPVYAFGGEKHWIDPDPESAVLVADEPALDPLARLPLDEWFSTYTWVESPTAPLDHTALAGNPERWLVFADGGPFGCAVIERLHTLGQTVTTVEPGRAFEAAGDAYALPPDRAAGFGALIRDLVERDALPHRVVHLWSAEHGAAPTFASHARDQDRAFLGLFHLARAFAEEAPGLALDLLVATSGAQRVDNERLARPDRATVVGAVRVLPREYPGWTTRWLDVHPEPGCVDGLLGEIVGGTDETVVALRGERRLRQERRPLDLPIATADAPPVLRTDGVYLVTGGLGGIGLALAAWLARAARAKLILTGRTGLPARAEWPAALAERPASRTAARIRGVQALEAAGAEVLVLAADVTDVDALCAAVDIACKRFGTLHGVFHAAGTLDDGAVALKTEDSVRNVLAPKVAGTLALEEALDGRELDFCVLFSSTSAALGLPGQADYTAANAFLDAFAESRSGGHTRWLSLAWGAWGEVGMAAAAARTLGLVEGTGSPEAHPLLGARVTDEPEAKVFRNRLAVEGNWILEGHRIRGRGALVPGTAYVELARAAFETSFPGEHGRIDHLVFASPLEVPDQGGREMRVELRRDGGGYSFAVSSANGSQSDWQDHVEGRVSVATAPPEAALDIAAVSARCDRREFRPGPKDPQTPQERYLDFGPRWRVLEWVRFGADEALASLALPEEFRGDLDAFALHPALLDIATGYGLSLVVGSGEASDLYVPLMYEHVDVRAPLPQRILSHVRSRPDNAPGRDTATFDVTLSDPDGRVLVEVSGFTVKRIGRPDQLPPTAPPVDASGASAAPVSIRTPLDLLRHSVEQGIRPHEGAAVVERALAHTGPTVILASSLDLDAVLDAAAPAPLAPSRSGSPGTQDTAPSGHADPVEAAIAGLWGDLLGIDDIRPTDTFFDLGGHSLLGIRVINWLNAHFGTHLAPVTLFEHPTIGELAAQIRAQKPELSAAKPAANAEAHSMAAPPPDSTDTRPTTPPRDRRTTPETVLPASRADLGAIAAAARGGDGSTGFDAKSGGAAPRARSAKDGKLFRMRRHWFAKRVLAPLYRVRSMRLRNLLKWGILRLEGGEWFTVTLRELYAAYHGLRVGDYSGSCFDVGYLKPGTTIGRYCSIFKTARIETANHPSTTVSSHGVFYHAGPGFAAGYEIPRTRVEIGHDVHIGHNAALVYPCSKIGNGAIVGAGTVVDFDVPPFAVVAGWPAQIVRYRFSKEKIAELEESRWWDASLEDLEAVREEFTRPVEAKSVR